MKKSLRFSIFERDCFTCQYCGMKPPETILHVDHMVSKKDGGTDIEENLITACEGCNLGKSSKSVNIEKIKKMSFKKEIADLEEKKAQLEAFYEYTKKKNKMQLEEVNIFQRCWRDCSGSGNKLTEFGLKNIKSLSQKYTTEMIFDAIRIAWEAEHVDEDKKFQYMCGVLKQMKLQKEDPEEAEHQRTLNKAAGLAKKKFNYFDIRQFYAISKNHTPEGMYMAVDSSRNWTEFKQFLDDLLSI